MFKNILVAIDGSTASTSALETACELSEKFGAGLHLLHVVREMQEMQNRHKLAHLLNRRLPAAGLGRESNRDFPDTLSPWAKR